jgi:transposase
MTYPFIIRAIVRDFYNKNSFSIRHVAKIFNISKSTVSRWINNKSLLLIKKKRPLKFSHILDSIKVHVKENPFIKLSTLKLFIKQSLNLNISISTLSKYLRIQI